MATPVTIPLAAPIDPIDGLLLLHVPPVEALDKVVVEPKQALSIPVIGCIASTVATVVTQQFAAIVYVIVAVDPATPVTIPDVCPTVAIAVLLLLHVPPVTVLVNTVVEPAHIIAFPLMDVGGRFTDVIVDAMHPVASV